MPSPRNKQLSLITSLSALLLAHAAWATHWHSGDLLFIETPCGAFCDAITSSTQSHYPLHFNHVAMIISSSQHHAPQIIEATTQGVHITSLPSFIQEHEVTKHNILIGRIKPTFAHLIPSSLRYARAQVNKPYNATFDDHTGQSYYCSQLIENSFYMANHHHRVFKLTPMNFKDSNTHQFNPYWVSYFKKRHHRIPQSQPGTNPTAMAFDPAIQWLKPLYPFGKRA